MLTKATSSWTRCSTSCLHFFSIILNFNDWTFYFQICREQFVALHSQPILENLSDFLTKRYSYPERYYFWSFLFSLLYETIFTVRLLIISFFFLVNLKRARLVQRIKNASIPCSGRFQKKEISTLRVFLNPSISLVRK